MQEEATAAADAIVAAVANREEKERAAAVAKRAKKERAAAAVSLFYFVETNCSNT